MTAELIRIVHPPIGHWYDEYRRLRHRVFVCEQGWRDLSSAGEPGLTPRDPVDGGAHFWLAYAGDGTLIGGVRVCGVFDAFPHEELFAHHLAVPAFEAMRPRLGTLNSLVVDARWRRRVCVDGDRRIGTVARLLLQSCVRDCPAAGVDALIATAQTIVSARSLIRHGFRVIDPPARTHLHPTFTMCNVGAVPRCEDFQAHALAGYFAAREQTVLGGRSVDACYADAALPVAG